MKLKSIKIYPYLKNPESALKAIVTASFTNSLVLQGMRLVEQKSVPETLHLVYPIQQTVEGVKGLYYPANQEYKKAMEEVVLAAYAEMPDKENRFTKKFEVEDNVEPLVLGRIQVYPHRTVDGRSLAKVHVTVEDSINLRFMQLSKNPQDGSLYVSIPFQEVSEKVRIPFYKLMDDTVRDSLLAQVLPAYEKAQQDLRRSRRSNQGPLTSRPFSVLK